MEIVVKPVCSRSDLRKFIHLPAKIHKDHLNWIPPLYSDEWEFFNARKNKAYGYSDVILLLGAVHTDYQNRGLDTILGSAMLYSARKQKMEYIDSHLEMETNTKVRAEMEYLGGKVYKTYRVFGKALGEMPTKEAEETSRKMTEAECI